MSISNQSITTDGSITLIDTGMLVVIDPNVELPHLLAAGVKPGATTLILDPSRDGVKQITEALTAKPYTSLHIVSHGAPGCLYLGNSELSLNTLEQYTELLRSWGQVKSPRRKSSKDRGIPFTFSLYLYGCNVAAGDAGTEFIERLHHLTGASIAASVHRTGSQELDGDWHLEVTIDPVEASLAFLENTLETYPSIFAPGDLDISFGNNGRIIWTSYLSPPYMDVTVQPDGRILLAGCTHNKNIKNMFRYNLDGSLDSSFGEQGGVKTKIGSNRGGFVQELTLQPDGKILLAGSIDDYVALSRFNYDGSLDSNFGEHGTVNDHSHYKSFAKGVALQLDGKILLSAKILRSEPILLRYNRDGSLDSSFGEQGQVIVNFLDRSSPISFALQPDDRILVTGSSSRSLLVRYNRDGSLDSSFGEQGQITREMNEPVYHPAWHTKVFLQPDGRILLAGTTRRDRAEEIALLRFNRDGSLDSSFGEGGKVFTALSAHVLDERLDRNVFLDLQPDGRILLVAGAKTFDHQQKTVLLRYNRDGSLDNSFGEQGVVTIDEEPYSSTLAFALQRDGKILVATVDQTRAILTRYEGYQPEVTLVRHQVSPNLAIYQYTIQPSLFYYLPEEFRLTRDDVAPYHPSLQVAFHTLPSQPGNTPDSHQVEFTFKAVPYLSQELRRAALNYIEQNNLVSTGTTPSLVPLNPDSARFFLSLPKEEGGFEMVERYEAYVLFNQHITDTLTLSPKAFAEVFHSMRVGGETLNGHVKVRLPGRDDEQSIPFSGRLDKMVGSITEQFLVNQSSADRTTYKINVINSIESPVTLREVSFELFDLDPLRWVSATVASDTLPLSLQSGEDEEIVVHSTQPISRASRARLGYINAKVDLDFEALWLSVQETPGWQELTHDVTVQVDERYFSGSDALDKVIVTFNDEEAIVTLTKDEPSKTVNLIKPFLLYLLRDEEANDYVYKVASYRNQQLVATGELSKDDAPLLNIVPPLEV